MIYYTAVHTRYLINSIIYTYKPMVNRVTTALVNNLYNALYKTVYNELFEF